MADGEETTRADRLEQRMSDRPWLTLTTVSTVVTILGVLAGGATWLAGQFQSSSEAHAESIRNARRDAWAAYGIADIRRTLVRNRVFECVAKEQRKATEPMVSSEVIACEQYRIEFNEASARADKAFNEAMALGKE